MKQKEKNPGKDYARPYYYWLAGFGVVFLLIILFPMLNGTKYDYEEAVLNQSYPIGSNIRVALVDRAFDPDELCARFDFYVTDTATGGTAISNIGYEVEARYITDMDAVLETSLTRVDDNYFVVLVEGVPEGFAVMSLTISPQYIYPALETTDHLSGRQLKLYINETEELVAAELNRGDSESYKNDYINVEIRFLQVEIADCLEAILDMELAISQAEEMIAGLKPEMIFQTQEEQTQTQSAISRYESSINSYEKSIQEARERVSMLEEKIALQEARRVVH